MILYCKSLKRNTCLITLILHMLLVYYHNIKTKIKLSEGDFCIYKLSYEDNDKLIINIQARSEEPEKDIFSLVVSNDNNVVYQATSVNSVNHILDIINTKEFEICFKPVYEDIVNLDYEINTSYEIGEYKLIAQKQQFENVSKDLDVLQGLLNSTTSDILNLSNKKHTHTVSKKINLIINYI